MKRGLCAFDNKRYILDDGITTLSYGHKDMNLVVEVDEVRDQQRATIIAAVELRKKGRRWQRRKVWRRGWVLIQRNRTQKERRRRWLQAKQCVNASVYALNKYLSCPTGTTQPQILMHLLPNANASASFDIQCATTFTTAFFARS